MSVSPSYGALVRGWAQEWQALGVKVVGWGWLEGDPISESNLAYALSRDFGLDGYIANAEDSYEGSANFWKSAAFVKRFRELAPNAPLALSHIGYGNPHRFLDFQSWLNAGAVVMPQTYWADRAIPVDDVIWSADNYGTPRARVVPTIGTSTFAQQYPPELQVEELLRAGVRGWNIWLLDSTTDDVLRALAPAIPA